MITFDRVLKAKENAHIRDLNFNALSVADVANLALQRSEIIGDQEDGPAAVTAWARGNSEPLKALVSTDISEFTRRAAAVIYLEYLEVAEAMSMVGPHRVADIGCGYALFDYFLWRDHACELCLIDLEDSDARHFGFKAAGAAYSSLRVAKQFLADNGVPEASIHCINPRDQDVMALGQVDLAISFLSCGFHYPVSTYAEFFTDRVTASGSIAVDVRKPRLKQQLPALENLGTVTQLVEAAQGKAVRLMITKPGA